MPRDVKVGVAAIQDQSHAVFRLEDNLVVDHVVAVRGHDVLAAVLDAVIRAADLAAAQGQGSHAQVREGPVQVRADQDPVRRDQDQALHVRVPALDLEDHVQVPADRGQVPEDRGLVQDHGHAAVLNQGRDPAHVAVPVVHAVAPDVLVRVRIEVAVVPVQGHVPDQVLDALDPALAARDLVPVDPDQVHDVLGQVHDVLDQVPEDHAQVLVVHVPVLLDRALFPAALVPVPVSPDHDLVVALENCQNHALDRVVNQAADPDHVQNQDHAVALHHLQQNPKNLDISATFSVTQRVSNDDEYKRNCNFINLLSKYS